MLLLQAQPAQIPWAVVWGTAIATIAIVVGAFFLVRRIARNAVSEDSAENKVPSISENAPAFMAASMQGVIQKLREQEKELERLHREERERAESTERLSDEVTRNMPAGLLLVNSQKILVTANPAAELALANRGLKFRRFSEALGESSDLTRLISECLATGKVFQRENIQHRSPGGELRQLGVTISPTRKSDAEITGAICLLTDLTELTSLQKQMQLKENLAVLGELSAGIAHEFKNALATISGYAQMISADASGPDAAENAAKILDQTRSITHVVTEFLKYARPLDIAQEPVSLDGIVERVFSELAESFPAVRFRVDGFFGEIPGDEALLRQAFLNIVRNAAEACDGSSATAAVSIRGSSLSKDGHNLQRVVISDNGPGIATGSADKLFVPFFTTKPKGTGLGLAVVQKIIVQHGGQVEAQNLPDGGAAFTVTLPLCASAPEAVK